MNVFFRIMFFPKSLQLSQCVGSGSGRMKKWVLKFFVWFSGHWWSLTSHTCNDYGLHVVHDVSSKWDIIQPSPTQPSPCQGSDIMVPKVAASFKGFRMKSRQEWMRWFSRTPCSSESLVWNWGTGSSASSIKAWFYALFWNPSLNFLGWSEADEPHGCWSWKKCWSCLRK